MCLNRMEPIQHNKDKKFVVIVSDKKGGEGADVLTRVYDSNEPFLERVYKGTKPKNLRIGEVIHDKINDNESIFVIRVI